MKIEKITEGDIFIFSFSGNLILSELEEVRKLVKTTIENENANKVIFDMKDVDFIDSAGIGFIVSVYKSLKSKNGKFALSGLKKKPKEVFSLTRLDKIIKIYDDIETAKKEFKV